MNFFGHVVVASWESDSSPFLLGAMVPDFATMIGARVPLSTHAEVAGGIRFHHRTDQIFHDSETFRDLSRSARERLRALGVPRPQALAVGHIGVEILLDGALADADARRHYQGALAAGRDVTVSRSLAWAVPEVEGRFDALLDALASRGVPTETEGLSAFRIVRALAPRPKLRLDERGEVQVRAWAEEAEGEIRAAAPRLLAELRAGLGGPPPVAGNLTKKHSL